MYVMQSLPSHQQSVSPHIFLHLTSQNFPSDRHPIPAYTALLTPSKSAGGIFNMLIRLGSTVGIGVSTAVFSSLEETPAAQSQPMLPYKRAFDVSIGLAAMGCLIVPFVRLGTQGNVVARKEECNMDENGEGTAVKEKGEGEAAAPMGNGQDVILPTKEELS
jgi:hypothetical protein